MTAFLASLERRLADRAALTEAWRAGDALPEETDRVSIQVGLPDPAALAALEREVQATRGAPLPPDLAALLQRFNGIAVHGQEGEERCEVVPPGDLSEPALWPAGYGDPFMLDAGDLVPGSDLLLIGEICDSGWLALAMPRHGGAGPVFWIDTEFHVVAPRVVAAGVAELVERWCDAALSVPLLLRAAGVPGWGG